MTRAADLPRYFVVYALSDGSAVVESVETQEAADIVLEALSPETADHVLPNVPDDVIAFADRLGEYSRGAWWLKVNRYAAVYDRTPAQ